LAALASLASLALLAAGSGIGWWLASRPISDRAQIGTANAEVIMPAATILAATTPTATGNTPAPPGALLAEKLETSRQWLHAAPTGHWFLQLLTTNADSIEQIESLLRSGAGLADATQLRIYRSGASNAQRISVIYGDYPTLAQAKAEQAQLPAGFRPYNPYPRQVKELR